MATTIGTAYVQILPTTEGITESLTSTLTESANTAAASAGESSGSSFASKLTGGIGKAAAAIAGTATAAVAGVTAMANSTASYGDNIDKASQKLGVSSTFYQEWDAVLQHSGTSMSSMTSTFKTLANASQDASDDQVAAFEALGLSMDEVQNMSTEDLFTSVITGLQGMEEGTERTALATDLLGRGATEMGALLNTSAEDTQGMIDTVNELGGVMSEDAVKDAAAYEDALQDLQTSFSGIKNGVGAELLPVLTNLMGLVTESMPVIQEAVEPVLTGIGNAITSLSGFITEHWDTVQAIFNGVATTIQTVWDAISLIISSFVTAFQTATADINTDGLSIQDVFNAINTVISAVGTIIAEIITLIGEAIGWLVTEAQTDGTLINTVWENISTAVSTMWEAVQEILQFFIDLLNGDFSDAFDDIGDLADTIFGGIYDVVVEDMQSASDFISGIIDTIKGWFDFDITWPNIPLPHINYTLIDIPLLGSIPDPTSLSVSWYAKAMNKASVLDGATIFGASGGSLLGGGEAGREVVSGEAHLIDLIEGSVSDALDKRLESIESILTKYMPDAAEKNIVLDSGTLVGAISSQVDSSLGKTYKRALRGY